jgi:hypothetical protein
LPVAKSTAVAGGFSTPIDAEYLRRGRHLVPSARAALGRLSALSVFL